MQLGQFHVLISWLNKIRHSICIWRGVTIQIRYARFERWCGTRLGENAFLKFHEYPCAQNLISKIFVKVIDDACGILLSLMTSRMDWYILLGIEVVAVIVLVVTIVVDETDGTSVLGRSVVAAVVRRNVQISAHYFIEPYSTTSHNLYLALMPGPIWYLIYNMSCKLFIQIGLVMKRFCNHPKAKLVQNRVSD